MINGTIPTEIGEMKSLRGFLVCKCWILSCSDIVANVYSVSQIFSLTPSWIILDLNDLVGPIPNEIGGASSLEYLITGKFGVVVCHSIDSIGAFGLTIISFGILH